MKVFWLITAVAYACLILAGFVMSFIPLPILGGGINWGTVILVSLIPYSLLGIRILKPNEVGVKLLFFSRPIQQANKGPIFVPPLLFTLRRLPTRTIQDQYPGETDDIFWGDQETQILPPGKVWPMRVTTGYPKSDDGDPFKNDPTNVRLTLSISALARWRIENGAQFIRSISTIKEARRQIRDTVEGAIIAEFGKDTHPRITLNLGEINEAIRLAVQNLVTGIHQDDKDKSDKPNAWGIIIGDVGLVRIELPRRVNKALRNVSAAQARKQVTITNAEAEKDASKETAEKTIRLAEGNKVARVRQAEGEKEALILEGTGTAEARRLLLNAEAEGRKALVKASGSQAGKLIAYLEVLGQALNGAKYSIIPGGELYSAVGGIQQILQQIKPPPEKPAPPQLPTSP